MEMWGEVLDCFEYFFGAKHGVVGETIAVRGIRVAAEVEQ